MDVLFIGNSYTYYNDMPKMFEQLAVSNNKNITVHSITQGGRKLNSYADNEDPVTIVLDALLNEQKFDICFIQEQSVLPATDFDGFIEGLDCVINKLRTKADHFILYATWGRKAGSSILEDHHWTTESMTNLVTAAYRKAAKLYNAQVSPVGNNFLYITNQYPDIDLYNEDLSHPSYLGSCLSALTHYYTVFHEFPTQTDVLSLGKTEISAFQEAVSH